jgi:predicted transcriptional regulator
MSMKTTVDLPDHLLSRMHELAARERTSFRALLEAAVQQFLGARGRAGGRFRLEDRSVDGRGVVADLRGKGGRAVLDRAYEGRGG